MLDIAALVASLGSARPGATAAVAAAASLAAVYWLLLAPSRAHRAVAHLPRPRGSLPFLGATLLFMNTHRGRMHLWFYEEALRLGGKPFAIDMPTRQPVVVLSDAETMTEVLKTQAHKFAKGENFAESLSDVFGEGAFVAEGPKGVHQRRTTSHFFAPPMVREITEGVITRLTTKLCAIVADAARAGREIDMKHLLELFATDVSTSIGFGVDLQFMEKENREFLERFERARFVTLFRQQQPAFLWKLQRLLRVGFEGQQLRDVAWLDAFVYKIIQDAMARHAAEKDGDARDILSLFLHNSGDQIDVRELRDMAMVLLSAGRKTTAYALSWAVAMAVEHPEAQRKIREELWAQVPELMRGEIDVPSKDQAARLVYLEAFVKENLRLNTVVPVNTREAVDDVLLADGTFLAKGTQVLLSWYGMSRLPATWGPDATAFRPERWLDPATGRLRAMSQVQLIAFSAGRRVCPAKHFAIVEMKMVLAALLSKFDFASAMEPGAYAHDATVALAIAGPQWVRPTLAASGAA